MENSLLEYFIPKNWDRLNTTQKYIILEKCVEEICKSHNLPKVNISFVKDDDCIACYNYIHNGIFFNLDYVNDLASGYEILIACLHECRHYEQKFDNEFNLKIGTYKNELYYFDYPEYDAHFYACLSAKENWENFFKDKEFKEAYRSELTKYFIGYAEFLKKHNIIKYFDKDKFENIFLEKYFNKNSKNEKYTKDFLIAYYKFTNRENFKEIYSKCVEPHRKEMYENIKPLLERQIPFLFDGPSRSQQITTYDFDFELSQNENHLNFTVTDKLQNVSLNLFIKEDEAICWLDAKTKRLEDIQTVQLENFAKAIIEGYEQSSFYKINKIDILNPTIHSPVFQISDKKINLPQLENLEKELPLSYDLDKKYLFKLLVADYKNNIEIIPAQQKYKRLEEIFEKFAYNENQMMR